MIIDIHSHLTEPEELGNYLRAVTGMTGAANRVFKAPVVSDDQLESLLQSHLESITAVGTDFQLIAPRPSLLATADHRNPIVRGVVRSLNDLIAQAVRLHPDRFAGIGVLPQSPSVDPGDAIEEMNRCVADLGFVGFSINPDPGQGGWSAPEMGEEYWYPIYNRACELDVPLQIHAGGFMFSPLDELGYLMQEESVAAWTILRSPQVFRDFPNLRIVLPHGGAYIPYQYGRARCFRLNERTRGGDHPLWEPFDDSAQRVYFDTVLYDPNALDLLLRLCGPSRCLFGSDRPSVASVINPATGRAMNDVKTLVDDNQRIGNEERQAVFENNAHKVFPRLKA